MHLAAVLLSDTIEGLIMQTEIAIQRNATLLEFRLDALKNLSYASLADLFSKIQVPKIVTYRSTWNNGRSTLARSDREELLLTLSEMDIDFIDFEYPHDMALVPKIPDNVRIVLSFFDFEGLAKIYFETIESIIQTYPKLIIKIGATPVNISDLKVLWRWAHILRKNNIDHIVFGLGQIGQITRIKGYDLGNVWAYGQIDEKIGEPFSPGMLRLSVIERSLDPETIIVGQIGTKHFRYYSRGVRFLYKLMGKKAIALNIPLEYEAEMVGLLNWIKDGLFDYLIVEDNWSDILVSYLDSEDISVTETFRCNLIKVVNKELVGYNTEYYIIQSLVEDYIRETLPPFVYIEGVNSIGKAAIGYFLSINSEVTIRNRTSSKTENLMRRYPKLINSKKSLIQNYDILVNCIPFGLPGLPKMTPVPLSILNNLRLVIDSVIAPDELPLFIEQENFNFEYVDGKEVFIDKLLEIIKIVNGQTPPKASLDVSILFRDL